ncbi:PTS lactose/cellobiose transporter subunit IIA [Photobacterium sp. DNB23_23_1]
MEITEEFLMGLLCQAGEARSLTMQAISLAKKGSFEEADQLLASSDEAFANVHKLQTDLIGYDEGSGKVTMTLILTHIQDHIMTGMLCRDLATEIIELHKRIA